MPITATAQVCWAVRSSAQSCLSGTLSTETRTKHIQIGALPDIFMPFNSQSHTSALTYTQVVLQGNIATCE